MKKQVRFASDTHLASTHYVDPIASECWQNVYYSPKQLRQMQNHEHMKIDHFQKCYGEKCYLMESDQMSWRGLEALQEGNDKSAKVAQHVQAVLDEMKKKHNDNDHNNSTPEAIRAVASNLSKRDKEVAKELAARDAEVVRHDDLCHSDRSSHSFSRKGRTRSILRKLKRAVKPRKIAAVN